MAADNTRINDYLKLLLKDKSVEDLKQQLEPDFSQPAKRLPRNPRITKDVLERRWAILGEESAKDALLDAETLEQSGLFEHNIEHKIILTEHL